jgi:hypothetical protein
MSFGARIWDANGNLVMDENSFTMRVVLSQVVSIARGSQTYQTFSVPGITPSNGSAVVLPVGAFSGTDTQYETEVINDAVRVYNYIRGYTGAAISSVASMRLIVMRFS